MALFIYYLAIHFCFKLDVATAAQNVLMIVADDLRPSLGALGDPDAVSPNIDNLIHAGVNFNLAFAQQSLCAPSRNSFLTSRRPDTLHLYDFSTYWRTFAGNYTTLPQYFKENNYHTKNIGKIFHPGNSSNGTDDYPYSWSEKPWHPSSEAYENKPFCQNGTGSFKNLVCPVVVEDQPEKTLPDIQSINEAIKFLKSQENSVQPFFLAVGLHKPHIPLKFPKEYLDLHPIGNITVPGLSDYPPGLPMVAWSPWNDIRKRDDIAGLNIPYPFHSIPDDWVKLIRQSYFSSVSYIDDLIGKLLQNLESLNLDENTIVVLLGDHGWSLGEHGEWSKYSNFDITLRVPLIFRIPNITYFPRTGEIKGQNIQFPVELVDVFPTLVDLAGLKSIPKCPKNLPNVTLCTEGKSLAPFILQEIDVNETFYAFSQYPRPGVRPTKKPDSDKPHMNEIKFMGYSIRTPIYRYTQWIAWDASTLTGNWSDVNQTELYNHLFDKDENLNIAGRPGLEELEKTLSALLRKKFFTLN